MNFTLSGSASLFLLYQTFSSVANDVVIGALICLRINTDELYFLSARGIVRKLKSKFGMYASIFWLKGENAFKPVFTVWTILSAILFNWRWYGVVLYDIHPIFLKHNSKLSSQNSGALSVTMVFGTRFLANIVLNICLKVVAFLSLIFITSG